MRIKYENYSIFVCQLKELLHDFNLPILKVYTDDTILHNGRCYIKNNNIVKYENNDFITIGSYVFNKEIINVTKNLIINSSNYDQYTHEYFGNYLRFMRDYKDYNLMSLYNCFNYDQPSTIIYSLKLNSDNYFNINTDDTSYVYYILPVKFDQVYTVALDSSVEYEIACILYNNRFIDTTPESLVNASYKKINGSKFTNPFIYDTHFKEDENYISENYWQKEKDLKLLLKLPASVKTSITILEGNYIECANVIDGTYTSNYIYDSEKLPNIYYSKNSLLSLNNNRSYPFSDRIVEYITGNAISNIDNIDQNIERVQENLYKNGIKGTYGIWNNILKNDIYKQTIKQDITRGTTPRWGYNINGLSYKPKTFRDLYSDLTCYVDKDVETMLNILGGTSDETNR